MEATARVLYGNVKPYDVPSSLSELRGPAHGIIILPLNVYWGPEPEVDLDTEDGISKAYQSVIQEGRTQDQVDLLNFETLVAVWRELLLPRRARQAWEAKFPILAPR